MPTFDVTRNAFTPSATQNWVLWADAAGEYAKVKSVHWGGSAPASAPAVTRWVRPTTAGSGAAVVTLTPQAPSYKLPTAACLCGTVTTPPTLPASPISLFLTDWNKFGGLGRYNMDDLEYWEIINGAAGPATQIVCAQDLELTANTMSAGLSWIE